MSGQPSRVLWSLSVCLVVSACDREASLPRAANPDQAADPARPGASAPAQGDSAPGQAAGSTDQTAPGASLGPTPSAQPALQWKRYAAFEADLAAALELPKASLCTEFGRENCIRGVHLSPLGGHDPFKSGLLEPSAEPLATTPTVVERIVLSACAQRAELDGAAGKGALVFTGLDLASQAPAPTDPATLGVVTALYRRLLGRDPKPEERATVAALSLAASGGAEPALTFVKNACFAVGSTSEFLFF